MTVVFYYMDYYNVGESEQRTILIVISSSIQYVSIFLNGYDYLFVYSMLPIGIPNQIRCDGLRMCLGVSH